MVIIQLFLTTYFKQFYCFLSSLLIKTMIRIDNNQPGQLMLVEIAFVNVIKDDVLAILLAFLQPSIYFIASMPTS